MSALDTVRDALTAAGCAPKGSSARCPAHDDSTASLSVKEGREGRVLLKCHTGCAFEEIVAALDLEESDAFEPTERSGGLGEVIDSYDYQLADGTPALRVNRFHPKAFRQQHWTGSSWANGKGTTPHLLYRLPEVLAECERGGTVWVAEGEKDVAALERAGVVATCNAMGATNFYGEHAEQLRGASLVVIVADRDARGYEHARKVAAELTFLGIEHKIVAAIAGKDAADHLGRGHGLDEFESVVDLDAYGPPPVDARSDVQTPPEGFELWTPGQSAPRPQPAPEMFHGPLGAFALEAAEHTEADPVAIFAQVLTMFGVAANRSAYLQAGNSKHPAALFSLIVGATSKGKKGTALAVAESLMRRIAPEIIEARRFSGFGSGEAIIETLAAGIDIAGSSDCRALIVESEFSGLLAASGRQGATISETIRNAWDGSPLSNRTRSTGKLVASDYHLGAIGHITAGEWRAKVASVDLSNGMANRWLFFYVERGRLHPDGGNVPPSLFDRYAAQVRDNLRKAWGRAEMSRTPEAAELWRRVYVDLAADDPPGALGTVISRADAQALRISLALALADGAEAIGVEHVRAAVAVWNYCRASAAHLVGDSTGNSDADRLLDALRDAGDEGLDGTTQRDLFGRHTGKADPARRLLEARSLAWSVKVPTGGRDRTVTYAITPTRSDLSSLRSLSSQSHSYGEEIEDYTDRATKATKGASKDTDTKSATATEATKATEVRSFRPF